MTYLAHIAGDGRKQTAAEHLNGTAERCALFAAPFGAEELGRLAGLSHKCRKPVSEDSMPLSVKTTVENE